MAKLEVEIGADNSELKNKIKEVEFDIKQLSNLKIEKIKLGLDTKALDANIKDAKKSLVDLKTTLRDTGNSVGKDFTPKVANGGNALTQFNRIIQDAPFGPMGVQNNITAFGESFGYLVNQTGSARLAFNAMVGSLIGSGGVMLALSAVTSGLTYMSQNGLTVGDVFNKLTGDFDETKKAMQDLSVETIKNAQAQISTVGAYVSAAKNINLSMSDRLLAVKKLQDEYPAYFGNLTKEQILNGNVATAVKGVTAALIAKAKASALTDRIVKLAEEEEKVQNKINDAIATTFKMYKLNAQQTANAKAVLLRQLSGEVDLTAEVEKGNAQNLTTAGKTAEAAYRYSATLRDLGGELRTNKAEQDRLTKSLEVATAAQIKLDTVTEKGKKAKPANVTPQVSGLGSPLQANGLKDTAGQVMQIAKNVQGAEGVITTSLKNIRERFDSSGLFMLELLYNFNQEASKLITGSITNTFNSLGDTIANSLANGGNVIQSIGNSLLQSIGGFISDMGGLLIKYGTLAVVKGKLDLAIAAGGPLSIGAGLAAIAVGVALKAAGGAIGQRAQSGSGGSVQAGNSVSTPTSSTGSSGGSSFTGGTVVFEISGQSLVGVLSNTLDKNRRLGGSLSIG